MEKQFMNILQWWNSLSSNTKDGIRILGVFCLIFIVGSIEDPADYRSNRTEYTYEEPVDSYSTLVKEDPLSYLCDLESYSKEDLEELYRIIEEDGDMHVVAATVYNPEPGQCDSDPFLTADLSKIDPGKLRSGKIKWIAVSRDLLQYYDYGDRVLITSASDSTINGVYEIHDTMNSRWSRKIDFLKSKDEKTQGLWPRDIIIRRVA